MIIICLGNPGSGKTASVVRELALRNNGRTTYTNIDFKKKLPHVKTIEASMIVTKEVKHVKRSGEEVYNYKVNKEFWQGLKEPVNVALDEVHTIANARRSSSGVNVAFTDWLALIRRVLGQAESGEGILYLISQLANRIDIIAREMATQVRYHVCHYRKRCEECGISWSETSEMPEPLWRCPICKKTEHVKKYNHRIEVYHFRDMQSFLGWRDFKYKTFYRHYFIEDIEQYFPLYDTLSWENLISELY